MQPGYKMLRELNLIPPAPRKTKKVTKKKVTKKPSTSAATGSKKIRCRCQCAKKLTIGKQGGMYYLRNGKKVYCGKKLGNVTKGCVKHCPLLRTPSL
tara:strand:- start:1309 stop:1599 length:291 start_codon:yes stop_codon:yes gene_type:complete